VWSSALRPLVLAAALASPVALAAPPARAAAEAPLGLDYLTDPALPACPTAADFRGEVARELGHDPFADGAPRRLVVRLYPAGARLGGRVEWRDARDEWEGERTFASRKESCAEMARAMALATAIQIQLLARLGDVSPPKSDQAAPPPPSPPSLPPPSPSPPPPTAGAPPPIAPPRIAVDGGAGVIQHLGDSPAFIVPRIAVSLGRPSAVNLQLAVSGLGPGAEVTRPEGVATLDLVVITLELVRSFRPSALVQPLLAAGVGWQDVRARGTSAMPSLAAAHDGQASSALVSAGGGLAFALASRLAAVIEVEAHLFRPSVTIDVGSSRAAHLDGATLFAHGGLLARF
jgi:hypothetical protein